MAWDKNDWQGKTEEQVKSSYIAAFISVVFCISIIIWLLL